MRNAASYVAQAIMFTVHNMQAGEKHLQQQVNTPVSFDAISPKCLGQLHGPT